MPNSGSGDPTDPLEPVGPGRSEALTPSDGAAGPGAIEGPRAASSAIAADRVEGASAEAIASALSAGTIDAPTARAQLIDRAVRSRLPADASPEAIAAICAEVEALLGGDPLLDGLLRP